LSDRHVECFVIDHVRSPVDAWVQRRGVSGVIGLRLLPVVPFNALNYAFGLSSVRRREHAVGTAIGILPGSVAFVALGDSIAAEARGLGPRRR